MKLAVVLANILISEFNSFTNSLSNSLFISLSSRLSINNISFRLSVEINNDNASGDS